MDVCKYVCMHTFVHTYVFRKSGEWLAQEMNEWKTNSDRMRQTTQPGKERLKSWKQQIELTKLEVDKTEKSEMIAKSICRYVYMYICI